MNLDLITSSFVTPNGSIVSNWFFAPLYSCVSVSFCLSTFSSLLGSFPFFFPPSFESCDIYYQNLNAYCNTGLTFLSLIEVWKSILLSWKDNYTVQRFVSPLETSGKQLRLDINKANKKKLQCQSVTATRSEKTISFYLAAARVFWKSSWILNGRWLFFVKKINPHMTNWIALVTNLYWVENLNSYNEYYSFFVRHVGLMTIKVSVIHFKSQLDCIW